MGPELRLNNVYAFSIALLILLMTTHFRANCRKRTENVVFDHTHFLSGIHREKRCNMFIYLDYIFVFLQNSENAT